MKDKDKISVEEIAEILNRDAPNNWSFRCIGKQLFLIYTSNLPYEENNEEE